MGSLQGGLRYAMFMIDDPFGSTTGGFEKNGKFYPFTIVDGYVYYRKAELLLLDKARKIYLLKDGKTFKGIVSDLEKDIPEILTLLKICENNLGIAPIDINFKLNCRIDFDTEHQIPKKLQNLPINYRGMITSIYTAYWDHSPMHSDIDNQFLSQGKWYYIPEIRNKMRTEHLEATKRKVYTTKDVKHVW